MIIVTWGIASSAGRSTLDQVHSAEGVKGILGLHKDCAPPKGDEHFGWEAPWAKLNPSLYKPFGKCLHDHDSVHVGWASVWAVSVPLPT